MPDGSYSVSDIQDNIKNIVKKYRTLTTISPFHVYINRIYNRLVLKVKDGYKLETQMPETMKLFGSTKKLIDKTKHGENVPSLEVVEVVLVQCNLVENKYQPKFEVLFTFTNKSYAHLSNFAAGSLVFLKTYNTEFDEIMITFTDQNGNLALLINKQKCDDVLYSQEQKNISKDMDFYHLQENMKSNY